METTNQDMENLKKSTVSEIQSVVTTDDSSNGKVSKHMQKLYDRRNNLLTQLLRGKKVGMAKEVVDEINDEINKLTKQIQEALKQEGIFDPSEDASKDVIEVPPAEIEAFNPDVSKNEENVLVSPFEELVIDPELEDLLPPLSQQKYANLELKIKKEGCRTKIVYWNNNGTKIVVDGRSCFKICKSHNYPFVAVEQRFASKAEVKKWIIENQIDRRNLNLYQIIVVGLRWAEIRLPQSKGNKLSGLKQNTSVHRNSDLRLVPINITQDAANFAGVHYETASKVRQILKLASNEDKELLAAGIKSINEVYNSIKKGERLPISKPDSKENMVESSSKTHQFHQINPKWSQLPITKLRELKVKELIDENTVLFICTNPPAQENIVTAITTNGFATVKYSEWVKLIDKANKQSMSENDLIAFLQEKI